jgi:hypothetical protein
MIGGTLNIKHVRAHWDEILRLATSIKQGTVTASLMLGSSAATRARTAWPSPCVSWAHRAHAVHPGLAAKRRAAPPRACRAEQGRSAQRAGPRRVLQPPGEIRDRSFEQQRYRATVKPSMTACCSTCRRSAGSTST